MAALRLRWIADARLSRVPVTMTSPTSVSASEPAVGAWAGAVCAAAPLAAPNTSRATTPRDDAFKARLRIEVNFDMWPPGFNRVSKNLAVRLSGPI
ncbi:hypothetical protein [Brevundimonas subvibrioides]|uniref:hypothetical protein n=1 Tax=Brevundimonas subvibrioides TaxID=74313 RepID=UPI0032D572C5